MDWLSELRAYKTRPQRIDILKINPIRAYVRTFDNSLLSFQIQNNREIRRAVKTKAPLRVQFLLTFLGGGGKEQEVSALLSKKEGEGGVYRESAKVLLFQL